MNIAGMWDQLIDCICRPPRDEYSLDELVGGTKGTFTLSGRPYVRQDSSLTNKAGQKLVSSHYRSAEAVNTKVPQPCVIYCHCNSGSRRDAEEALYILLPHNISVFCLDFAGSGRSEGDWVTLGALEVDDLEAAVDHLRRTGSATTIGLWGRSMGAVTALLYSQRDPSIAGMVLDSPFSRLTDLMMELVEEQKLPIPKPFMKMALGMMRRSVRKRAHFNIDHVAPLDAVPQSFSPALFGHAEGDTFIHKHHSERLHKAYAGDKNLITFEGDHNSMRPQFFYNSVLIFMHNVLQCTAMLLPETVASAKRSSQADDLPPEPLRALATQTSLRSQRSVPWTQTPTWNGNRDEFAQLWDEEVARSQQAGDSEDSQSETASQGDVQDTGAPVQRSSQAEAHARALAVEEELMVARALEMSLMDSIQQACPGHPPSNLSQPVERGGQQRQASLDAVVPAAMQQMDPLDAEEMMLIQAIQASLREADKLEQAPSPAQAADTKPSAAPLSAEASMPHSTAPCSGSQERVGNWHAQADLSNNRPSASAAQPASVAAGQQQLSGSPAPPGIAAQGTAAETSLTGQNERESSSISADTSSLPVDTSSRPMNAAATSELQNTPIPSAQGSASQQQEGTPSVQNNIRKPDIRGLLKQVS